jgi:hypothetical protein
MPASKLLPVVYEFTDEESTGTTDGWMVKRDFVRFPTETNLNLQEESTKSQMSTTASSF